MTLIIVHKGLVMVIVCAFVVRFGSPILKDLRLFFPNKVRNNKEKPRSSKRY
jgi:hypothetical protein